MREEELGEPMDRIAFVTRITCALCALTLATPAAGQEDRRVLLWQLSTPEEIQPAQREAFQDLLAAGIAARGREVLTDRDVVKMVEFEETRLRCGSDVSCIAEIGAALGVPEIVSGSVARIGQTWVLGLQRIDARNARVLARCARRFKGPVDKLLDEVPPALDELYGPAAGRAAPPPEALPAVAAGPRYPANPYKVWGHASFWSGLVLAGGGVAMGLLAADAKDDANKATTPEGLADAQDRMDTYNGLAVTGYVLGAGLLTTGVILWVLSPGDEAWAKRHGLALGPAVGPGTAGVTVGWRF